MLARETVDIIRQAEQEADQIGKEAAAECERIVQAAHEEAARHFENITEKSRIRAKEILESARWQGDEIIARQLQEAEGYNNTISESSRRKRARAIRLIIFRTVLSFQKVLNKGAAGRIRRNKIKWQFSMKRAIYALSGDRRPILEALQQFGSVQVNNLQADDYFIRKILRRSD